MTKKQQRQKVFEKFDGHCAYCGNPLADKFHVDHLIPVQRIFKWENGNHIATNKMKNPELDCFENMMPSCPPCNLRYGLFIENPIEIVFNFERLKIEEFIKFNSYSFSINDILEEYEKYKDFTYVSHSFKKVFEEFSNIFRRE